MMDHHQLRQVNSAGTVPRRLLGWTGEYVSSICLGGFAVGEAAKARGRAYAVRLVRTALDHGITFIDTAWFYQRGLSEEIIGEACEGRSVFLMTKVWARDYQTARLQVEESRRRLRVATIDLVQLHELNIPADVAACCGPDGALTALVEAQHEGTIRYYGFTGHKDPAVHLQALPLARWATAQLPLNVCDFHFRSFHDVLPSCLASGVAPLGMKSLLRWWWE